MLSRSFRNSAASLALATAAGAASAALVVTPLDLDNNPTTEDAVHVSGLGSMPPGTYFTLGGASDFPDAQDDVADRNGRLLTRGELISIFNEIGGMFSNSTLFGLDMFGDVAHIERFTIGANTFAGTVNSAGVISGINLSDPRAFEVVADAVGFIPDQRQQPVPTPGSLPLALASLAAMGGVAAARRRREEGVKAAPALAA